MVAAAAQAAAYPCTNHFLERWAERFPGEGLAGLAAAFARAERLPTGRLLAWLERSGSRTVIRPENRYWHDPVTDALFTAAPKADRAGDEGYLLMTVYRVRQPGRRRVVA